MMQCVYARATSPCRSDGWVYSGRACEREGGKAYLRTSSMLTLGRESEAALEGPPAVVMLHSVCIEHLYFSIVAHYVQLHMYFSVGCQLHRYISYQHSQGHTMRAGRAMMDVDRKCEVQSSCPWH